MNIAILTLTVTAAATLTANRAVTVAGAVPAAAGNVFGFTRSSGNAGDLVPVDVLGTARVEAGGAIAAGVAVEVDAQGRVVTLASGVKVGRLVPGQAAAAAAGDLIEILLIPN